MDSAADVVVIGAGIVGASCAHHLTALGADVMLLEKADAPAEGSTGRSAAGVRVQFTQTTNIRLSLSSIEDFEQFEARFGIDSGYRPIGYLLLVPDDQWDDHLAGVERQRAEGAPVEVLTVDQVRSRFAEVVPDGLAGATFGPRDGIIDPHSVTLGYLEAARARGARLHLRSGVTAITRREGRWVVTTDGDETTVEAETIVNAAGCWAGEVAALAGFEVPVAPVRRSVYATAAVPGRSALPLTVDLSSGVWFRPEGDRLIFGRSNLDEPTGFTEGVDWQALEPTLQLAAERHPWFMGESLDRKASWFGYYEETPDHNPILGRHPDEPNWVNACGFSGHGVQQAPAVGRVIAEEVTLGRAQHLDVDALRLERFRDGATTAERHVI